MPVRRLHFDPLRAGPGLRRAPPQILPRGVLDAVPFLHGLLGEAVGLLPDVRPDGRKSFSWNDQRDLIQTAHQQLGGAIVLVWDNLNTHLTAGMRRCIADRAWLTVVQLPPYATDLNPVEGIRSVLRRTPTANRAFADPTT